MVSNQTYIIYYDIGYQKNFKISPVSATDSVFYLIAVTSAWLVITATIGANNLDSNATRKPSHHENRRIYYSEKM